MGKIVVKNLSKIFGRRDRDAYEMMQQGLSKEEILMHTGATVAVRDVSFSVEEGEIFVVMGLSGSGKSTLLRCINLLHQPTAGEVIVNGNPLIRFNQKELWEVRRAWFGMVFQKFALFPHRSVMGNVEFGLEVQGVPKEERRSRAQKWIEAVGLKGWEDHYPQELSGGMQQRVGLARALAVEPEILLMDEAFSALDPLIRREMQDELLTLQAEMNKTIIFITHDFHEAVKLGDRIAVMRDGEFVQVGTPADIIGSPADEYVAAFADGIGLPPLKDDAG